MPKDDRPTPAHDGERRQALKTLGRFALYVTPAMTVLVEGAQAHHQPGHCAGGPGGARRCVSPA